jgi:hypothetical protein
MQFCPSHSSCILQLTSNFYVSHSSFFSHISRTSKNSLQKGSISLNIFLTSSSSSSSSLHGAKLARKKSNISLNVGLVPGLDCQHLFSKFRHLWALTIDNKIIVISCMTFKWKFLCQYLRTHHFLAIIITFFCEQFWPYFLFFYSLQYFRYPKEVQSYYPKRAFKVCYNTRNISFAIITFSNKHWML